MKTAAMKYQEMLFPSPLPGFFSPWGNIVKAVRNLRHVRPLQIYQLSKRQVIVLLRWLLIIILGYILLLAEGRSVPFGFSLALFILFAASNIGLAMVGEETAKRFRLDYVCIVLDVFFISIGIYLSADLDLYIVYFLTILISAFGRDIRMSLLNAVVSTAVYSFISYRLLGDHFYLSGNFLFRILFFYVVALITSIFSQEAKADQDRIKYTERHLGIIQAMANAKSIPDLLRKTCEAIFDRRWLKSLDLIALMPGGFEFAHCGLSGGRIQAKIHPYDEIFAYLPSASSATPLQGNGFGGEAIPPEHASGVLRLQDGSCVIPVTEHERVTAWIVARNRETADFTQHDEDALRLTAANLSSQLVRIGEEMAIAQRNMELAALINVNQTINQTMELDEVLDRIVAMTTTLLEVEAASIMLVDDERRELVFQAASGQKACEVKKISMPIDQGIAGWVVKEAQPIVVNDVRNDSRFFREADRQTGFKTKSLAAVPLSSMGKVIGVLEVINMRDATGFGEHHLTILKGIGFQAGIAIEMARIHRHMEEETNEAIELFRKLEQEKSRVETILASMGEAVAVCDERGEMTMVNRRGMSLLQAQCQAADRGEMTIGELEALMLRESMGTGEARVVKVKLPQASEAFQLRTTPIITPDGQVQGGVAVMEDVTELQRLNEMKTEFTSQVSHELRTPLTAITGAASLLLRGKGEGLDERQVTLLKVIREESGNMKSMVNNLLDLSRIELGVSRWQFEPGDPGHLLRQGIAAVLPLTMEKRLTLDDHEIAGDLPTVSMDADGIRRVMVNLLGNAVKFTPEGGTITVGAKIREGAEGQTPRELEIWVKDTGIGIPPEELQGVFEKFYRSTAARQQGIEGTGLGLTICREIVQAHGGRMWVESRPGVGSTFFFILPVM